MGNRVQVTASNWQVLSPLVDEALALAPEARGAWLDAQTQLSEAVHVQLAELIAVANAPETNTVLRTLPVLSSAAVADGQVAGTRTTGDVVGPYTLLRPIGRGGMAEVWLARRNDGAYERDIALKLPLGHLPLNHATERLLRERNVLAVLEHPSIARLYDAGVTPDGQPFLAMEYVEGESIRDYADNHQLGLLARGKLMLHVLDALHYAHQHLVVHRDLKPSNILVRADGRVALLDFGIAKVLGATNASADETELTRAAGNALTLAYAAPEQLLGEAVTTGTDIYSAGIVLFELLTGQRPFHGVERNSATLLRAMDEGVTRTSFDDREVSAAASHGFANARAWQQAYAGDLAAICARALRREPVERYASALSFREDLTRYFDHEPVLARGGAMAYYWRKFVERNRTVLAVSAAAAVTIGGLGAHAWNKTRELQLSSARTTAVESVMKSVFDGMSPDRNAPRVFSAKQLLDRSRSVLLQAGNMDGRAGSPARLMMANLYLEVGAYDDAIRLLDDEIADARTGGDLRRELWAQCLTADVYFETARAKEAHGMLRLALARLRAVAHESDEMLVEINYRIGTAALLMEDFAEAEQYLGTARSALSSIRDQPSGLLARVLNMQGMLARRRGDLDAAVSLFSEATKALRNSSGEELTKAAVSNNLLQVAIAGGRYEDALQTARAMQAEFGTRVAADSQWSLAVGYLYAMALTRTGKLDEAKKQIESVKTHAAGQPGQYADLAKTLDAQIALYQGNTSAAITAFNALFANANAALPSINSERARRNLAHGLLQNGQTDEALRLLQITEANQIALGYGGKQLDVALTRILLGCAHLRRQEWSRAESVLRPAHEALLAARGDSHYGTTLAAAYLALLPSSPRPNVQAATLAARIERDLAWQFGATELAAQLRQPPASARPIVPALL